MVDGFLSMPKALDLISSTTSNQSNRQTSCLCGRQDFPFFPGTFLKASLWYQGPFTDMRLEFIPAPDAWSALYRLQLVPSTRPLNQATAFLEASLEEDAPSCCLPELPRMHIICPLSMYKETSLRICLSHRCWKDLTFHQGPTRLL